MKICVLNSRNAPEFYDSLKNMGYDTRSVPFIADIEFQTGDKEMSEYCNDAVRNAGFIVLEKRMTPGMDDGYILKLFRDMKKFKELEFSVGEWLYNDGKITAYFNEGTSSIQLSERRLDDLLNMN